VILHHRKTQSEFFPFISFLFTLICNKSCEPLFIRHCRLWLRYYVNPWLTTSRSAKESLVIISRTDVRTFIWTVYSCAVELLCKLLNNIVLTFLLFLFITLFFYLLFFLFYLLCIYSLCCCLCVACVVSIAVRTKENSCSTALLVYYSSCAFLFLNA
jgi:hypothetical protein